MAKAKTKRKVKRKTGRGNFRRVSPAASIRYLKQWGARGVASADKIPAGPNAETQKIRFREAAAVVRDYQVRTEKHKVALANYDARLKEFKALGKKKVFTHGGFAAKLLRPVKPRQPNKAGRTGNFKRVTKAQAKAYLRALCRKAKDGPGAIYTANAKSIAAKVDGGDERTPRLQEAVMLLGPAEAAKIVASCEISRKKAEEAALKKQAAAEERKKKVDKAKLLKLERAIKRCEELVAKRKQALAGATAVAAAAPAQKKPIGWTARPSGLLVPAGRRRKRARRTRRHAR